MMALERNLSVLFTINQSVLNFRLDVIVAGPIMAEVCDADIIYGRWSKIIILKTTVMLQMRSAFILSDNQSTFSFRLYV